MAPSFLSKLVKAAATSTASTSDTDPPNKKKGAAAGTASTISTTTTDRSSSPSESRRSSFQVGLSTLTRGASRNRAVSSPPVSKHSTPANSTPSVHRRAIHRKAESAPHETPDTSTPPESLGVSQPESGRRSRRNSIITSVFGGGKKEKDIVPQAKGRQAPSSNGDTSGSARNHVAQSSTSTSTEYDGYDSSDDDDNEAIPRIVTVAPTRSRRGSRGSLTQSEASTQLGVTIIPPSPLTYAPSLPGTTSTRSSVKELPAAQNVAEATSQKQEPTTEEAQAQSVTTPTTATFPTSPPLSSTTPSSSPPQTATQTQTTGSILVSILSGRRRTASISSAISGIIGFGGSKSPELKETTESPVTPATEATPTPTTASTIKANYFASRQGSSEDVPPVPPLPESVTATSSSDSKSSTDSMGPARSQTTLAPAPERPGVPRRASSRSLTNLPPPIQVPDHSNTVPPVPNSHSAAAGHAQSSQHARAATTPEGHTVYAADPDTNVTMTPIVESPTMLKHPEFTTSPASTPASLPGRPPSSGGGGGGSWLSPKKGQDDDTASIISTNDGGGKKRLFKRSTSRKPTGLASALAATGMAMANPSISALHAAQMNTAMSQQSTSPARSQTEMMSPSSASPYLNKSPATSVVSNGGPQRSATAMVGSPKSAKSTGRKVSSPSSRKGKGSRRPSVSAYSDGAASWAGTSLSVNGGGSEYYSGGESEGARSHVSRASRRSRGRAAGSGNESDTEDESSDEGTTDSSDDDALLDSLSIDQDDIPVTGFAVASNKRNADFHELFPSVPEGDYLIEDYGCALQREILIQGRLYISENHICFHANIFGWITDLAIPIDEITSLEKKMTAFVIPNAIQITTRQARYTFASFLSRDTTYDVIYNIWRLQRPDDARSIRSGRGSLDAPASASALALEGATAGGAGGLKVGALAKKVARRATQCDCGRDGKHFTETAMEATFPGSPEMIHNLMFASGFIKDFLSVEQKLLDIQTSDWMPISPGSNLLQRNMTYIKPLNAPMGPKQTKCEIQDVMEHQDFDKYISTVTTTRTPDVPSGGVFSVKTRTCITWAGPASAEVVVTSQVEWTGRSFIKGIIERSAIDGQKVYHGELEKAMRAYIQEHHSEFVPEGALEAAAEEEGEPGEEDRTRELIAGGEASGVGGAEKSKEQLSKEEREKQREKERNQRVWQWAWDTCEGAFGVAKNSTKTIVDLIGDAWDQSSSTTILYFVIVILVLSNLYTLIRMGKKEEVGRRKEMMKAEEREKWVQSVVVTLWDELAAGRMEPGELRERFLEQTGRGKGPSPNGAQSLPASVMESLWASSSSLSSVAVPAPTEAATPSAVDDAPVARGEMEERLNVLETSLKATDERLKVVDETLQRTQESLENINRVLASFTKHHHPIDNLD